MKSIVQIRVEGTLKVAIPAFNSTQIVLLVDNQIILYTPANGQLHSTGLAYRPYLALPDNSWLCTSLGEDRNIGHLLPDGTLQPVADVKAVMSARPFPQPPADAFIVESEGVSYEFNTGYYDLRLKHPVTQAVVTKIGPSANHSLNQAGTRLLVGAFDWGQPPVASRYDLYQAPDWVKTSVPCETPLNVAFVGNKIIMAASHNGTIILYDPTAS